MSAGSHAAPRQRLACRIARYMARCAWRLARRRMLRDGPSGLPDSSLVYHCGGWFEACPVSCQVARSRRFGGGFDSRRARRLARWLAHGASADGSRWARRLARRLADGASADGSAETGTVSCPAARSLRSGSADRSTHSVLAKRLARQLPHR